jgi:hypothetical protein
LSGYTQVRPLHHPRYTQFLGRAYINHAYPRADCYVRGYALRIVFERITLTTSPPRVNGQHVAGLDWTSSKGAHQIAYVQREHDVQYRPFTVCQPANNPAASCS